LPYRSLQAERSLHGQRPLPTLSSGSQTAQAGIAEPNLELHLAGRLRPNAGQYFPEVRCHLQRTQAISRTPKTGSDGPDLAAWSWQEVAESGHWRLAIFSRLRVAFGGYCQSSLVAFLSSQPLGRAAAGGFAAGFARQDPTIKARAAVVQPPKGEATQCWSSWNARRH
jgi:hypothetical protein